MTARQQEFETLLAQHVGIVYRIVRTYSRNSDDQQDLAQEIKLQLWNSFSKWDRSRTFSTWIYRIALNTAISWLRKHSLRNRLSTPLDEQTTAAAPANDARFELDEIISRLDPMNQALLLLYLEELPHEEIGEVLGISAANVATRISRLKQQLHEQNKE